MYVKVTNNAVLTVFQVERNEALDGWDNRPMNEEYCCMG
jgi:hypothetical protein